MSDPLSYETRDLGHLFDWRYPENPMTGTVWYVPYIHTHVYMISFTNPKVSGRYIRGKFWWSAKITERRWSEKTKVFRSGLYMAYSGGFTAEPEWPYVPPNSWTTASTAQQGIADLNYDGAAVIARTRPDAPSFSFASSFWELKRDTPKALMKAVNGIRGKVKRENQKSGKRSVLSKTGDFHLSVHFGWLPLLEDIRKFTRSFIDRDKRLQQLIRDEMRGVRRRTKLTPAPSWSESYAYGKDTPYNGSMSPNLVTQCYGTGKASNFVRAEYLEEKWGVARYRYLLPPGPRDAAWMNKMYRRIMGARITPDTLYQLMPWSWMIDYFTDLGEFIRATDPGVGENLLIDYAFVMKTMTWRTTSVSSQSVLGIDGRDTQVRAGKDKDYTVKLRAVATPFGFGIKDSSLSLKQMGILGAIGASRLP